MAKLDKNFFDYSDLAKQEWRSLVVKAKDASSIVFDLENDESVEQRRVAVDTPEDAFESARGGMVDEKARFKCELCKAGGDWQQSTYYFRCQKYEGSAGIIGDGRFCLVPSKERGNVTLVKSEKGKWVPQDANKELGRDFDAEAKLCWDSLPDMLGEYIVMKRKDFEKMASRVASDPSVLYMSVPMVGRLNLNQEGGSYGILEISEDFKRSVFEAIREPGMEYDGEYKAHISVFTEDEMGQLVHPIEESGKAFRFSLRSIETVEPEGWDEMERVWFVTVESPELEALRLKYGFPAKLNGGHEFHITVAVKPNVRPCLENRISAMVLRVASWSVASCDLIRTAKPLISDIRVDTKKWQFSSGRKIPSGRGAWAFEIGGEEVMIPGTLQYADAKKKAVEMAKAKGVRSIVLLP